MNLIANRVRIVFMAWVYCGFVSPLPLTAAQDTVILEVRAGEHDREHVPLTFPLPPRFAEAKRLWMQRLDRGTTVSVQRTMSDPPQVVWMLEDRLSLRQVRRYRLSVTEFDRNEKARVTCTDDGQALTASVRGKPVLTYHSAVVDPPSGVDPVFRRSGFIHPLQTPTGRVLTEAFPADHLHQHGIFNAWVQTEFDGRPVDFWNQAGGTGTVEHAEVKHLASGPVFGEFSVRLRHLDLSAKPQPVPALDETWTVRVYDRSDRFVFDLESRQQCATERPLLLQEYHYGGMAFRGNSEWLGQAESGFLTSDGKSRIDGNHTRPHWTDAYGTLQGRPCGVAVLQHPSNPRFPSPVRLHPDKPYFVYTPVVLGELTIAPEQPLISRYRYVVHDELPDAEALNAAWADYAEPPEVRIIE
ncbi:MAG: PmoA family protein [Planctomycetaceae bacterium]